MENFEVNSVNFTADLLRTHNATITIENPQTGGHRTFKIHTARKGGLAGKRIISLLSGSDNERDYIGFGFVWSQENSWGINVWKSKDSPLMRKYVDMVTHPEGYPQCEYHVSTVCRRCNRKLTTPESITSGIGPECASKEGF